MAKMIVAEMAKYVWRNGKMSMAELAGRGLAVELVDCAAPGNANASATTGSERKKGIAVMEQLVKEMQKEMQKAPTGMSSFLVASLVCKRTAFKDRPPQQLEYSLNVHYGRPDVAGEEPSSNSPFMNHL